MLKDLDDTLITFLEQELGSTNATITFDTPDDSFPPNSVSLPAVNLFLYDIRENMDLHSNNYTLEYDASHNVTRYRHPIRVDCSYLITAWTKSTAGIEDEHQLLGEVMKVLMRYRQLPDDILQGELVGLTPPVRARAVRPGHVQSLGEFWQALGGKPKAFLNYTLTVSVDVFTPEDLGPAVSTNTIKVGLGTERD